MSFYNVKIYYGPSTSFYCFEYKPQRLLGLRDRLHKLGYRVNLLQVPYVNYCMIELCEHEVFRCNLKHLLFSTHSHRDVVATRAVEAVQAASAGLSRAADHLWFRNLINEDMFTRGPDAPRDYWPLDVDIKPYVTCNQCVACCDIAVTRKALREQAASKCYQFNVVSDIID